MLPRLGPARDSQDIPPYWRDTVDSKTAAAMLGVGRKHVARLCMTGKLPAYQKRPGHSRSPLMIPRVAVERLAMNAERSYWREMYAVEPEPPEPDDDRLPKRTQFRLDAERRDAAHRKRLEIGEFYDRASAEADRIREREDEPEEGKTVQLGFGYTEWTPVDNAYVGFECWPQRREFGERELSHGEFYSTSQVGRLLGVGRARVLDLRRTGRLQGYRLKKHENERGRGNWCWFYRKDDVEELVARRQAERRRRAKGRWGEEERGCAGVAPPEQRLHRTTRARRWWRQHRCGDSECSTAHGSHSATRLSRTVAGWAYEIIGASRRWGWRKRLSLNNRALGTVPAARTAYLVLARMRGGLAGPKAFALFHVGSPPLFQR